MRKSSLNKKTESQLDAHPSLVGSDEKVFGDIEDVISTGALLRPTIEHALRELSDGAHVRLKEDLNSVERAMAVSHRSYRIRMERGLEAFVRTFAYSPMFRFIESRILELLHRNEEASLTDFSKMSLIIGMIHEENQRYL